MTSAPPVLLMTQIPQYSTTTTARPITGNFQAPTFQMLQTHRQIHCRLNRGL